MKWSHLTVALQESLNLGVQQNHRYRSSALNCLSDIILFMVSQARGQERIKGEHESLSEKVRQSGFVLTVWHPDIPEG